MTQKRVFKLVSDGVDYNLDIGFVPSYIESVNYTQFQTEGKGVCYKYFDGMDENHALEEKTNKDSVVNRSVLASGGFSKNDSKKEHKKSDIQDVPKIKSAITGASKDNPCVITSAGHPFETGNEVRIVGVEGMTELNDRIFTITKVDNDSFELDGIDSSGYTTYTGAGEAIRANHTIVRSENHGLEEGDIIHIKDVVGMSELNNKRYVVEIVDKHNLKLKYTDVSLYADYVNGGNVIRNERKLGMRLGKSVMGSKGDIIYIQADMPHMYNDLGDVSNV